MTSDTENKTDAWMPLWIGAYLADTMRLTTAQHGGYLLLLMAYWRDREPLPDDDEELRSITKTDRTEWKKMRPVLAKFFRIGDGVWWHKRVEEEMAIADARQVAAQKKAKAGADARWGKSQKDASGNAPSMPQALPEDVPKLCPTPSPTPIGIPTGLDLKKSVCEPAPHTQFSDEFRTAAKSRPDVDAEVVWAKFNDHYPPESRTLHRWKTWLTNEQAPRSGAASPSVSDPDSRASIEAMAASKGMQPWDGYSVQWPVYKARVLGQEVTA